MSLPLLPVGKALVAMLEAGTTKRCGLFRLPTSPTGPVVPPYMVLTSTGRPVEEGAPLGNASDWTEQEWQITAVGGDRGDQALWMLDRAHGVMVDQTSAGVYVHTLTVAGMKVLERRLAVAVGPDESGGIVSLVNRYTITLTGA